jgi:putative aminopeptidase FrvX
MLTSTRLALGTILLLYWLLPPVAAQERPSVSDLAIRLSGWMAITGYEQAAVDSLLRLLPGSRRDRAGNAVLRLGNGSGKRLLVCPLDEPAYVVGTVRDDGYLTLRRVTGRVSALFDQQLEGHRVALQGARGVVSGVVAVRSIHLTRGRTAPSEVPFSVDDAYVDIGASSRAEVADLGVQVLTPVTLAKRPHRYGNGLLAAPVAGRRAACAALLVAVRRAVLRAKLLPPTTVAIAVEQELSQRGLATLGNVAGPFEETLMVDGDSGTVGAIRQTITSDTSRRLEKLGRVTRWSLPVRYAGTAVETVSLADADSLSQALGRWIGGDR